MPEKRCTERLNQCVQADLDELLSKTIDSRNLIITADYWKHREKIKTLTGDTERLSRQYKAQKDAVAKLEARVKLLRESRAGGQ